MMGTALVSIPLVTLRPDGLGGFRPRFIPGARMRALGLKGEDLRHPDGAWFSLDECARWSAARQKLVDELAGAPSKDKRRRIVANASGAITLAELAGKWEDDPRMNGKPVIEGRMERRPLSKATVDYYQWALGLVEALDAGRIWFSAAAAISTRVIDSPPPKGKPGSGGVLHRIEVAHGLASARAVRAALSALYGWGISHGLVASNPARSIRLPVPAARIRYGTPAEMRTLVAAADAIGLAEIGDAIMLGLWTGQRQETRLNLVDFQRSKDGILFRQSKKHGQPLLIPEAPELAARLLAARDRRRDWRVNYPNVVLDEEARAPFTGRSWYGVKFRRVRDAAVKGVEAPDGTIIVAKCASLVDFRDQDLRDTAVTWLALAGCDKILISSVTGHSLKSIDEILKHYLGLHPELARTAIGKLAAWYDLQGEGK